MSQSGYNSLLNGLVDVEGSSIGMAYFQLALANQVPCIVDIVRAIRVFLGSWDVLAIGISVVPDFGQNSVWH